MRFDRHNPVEGGNRKTDGQNKNINLRIPLAFLEGLQAFTQILLPRYPSHQLGHNDPDHKKKIIILIIKKANVQVGGFCVPTRDHARQHAYVSIRRGGENRSTWR